MNLDDFSSDAKPVGGLRSFAVLQNSQYAPNQNSGGPWTETWKHRGPFPFAIKAGTSCNLVFLTDVIPMIGHTVVVGENKGDQGFFPKTDFVRATNIQGFGDDGTPVVSDKPCPFRIALGRDPRLVYVAKIFDDIAYEDKKTKTTVTRTVRYIMIDRQEVLNVLCTLSQADGKSAQYRRFKITRTADKKSSRLGNTWVGLNILTPAQIEKACPGAFEKADKIDLEKGFPIYTLEEAQSILKLHKKIVDAHPQANRNDMTYDAAGMDSVLRGQLVASSSAAPSAGFSSASLNPDSLENLDDATDADMANPFPSED